MIMLLTPGSFQAEAKYHTRLAWIHLVQLYLDFLYFIPVIASQ